MTNYAEIRGHLQAAVTQARASIKTERDHALWPNHRADELVRDLLEDVLHQKEEA